MPTDAGEDRPHGLLIAPDSFKGTHTAAHVALAIARGAGPHMPVEACPLADGGEGTGRILVDALGGEILTRPAHDALGRPVTAELVLLRGGEMAVVEVASASGPAHLDPAEIDAEAAGTAGTGELLAAAAATGAREILLAAGGSATTDGGAGAIEALERAGGLRGASLTVLADVSTPFERAAEVYGPQKGAGADAVARLSARLDSYAQALPRDPRGRPMTGAAGGLAGGLWAACGARLVRGAPWILDAVGFAGRLERASAVITGEGRIDSQTLEGKVLFEVAARGREAGVPVHAVAGSCALGPEELASLGLASIRLASTTAQLEQAGRELAGG